jgi:hypothetical protein
MAAPKSITGKVTPLNSVTPAKAGCESGS